MRRNNNRKGSNPEDTMDGIGYTNKTRPGKGDENSVNMGIAIKSMRGLPHSSYSFPADPYTAANPPSEMYPPINGFNKTVGGFYRGERNLDGGNAGQYLTSVKSGLLKYFDFFRCGVNFHYRYVPLSKSNMKTVKGQIVGQRLVDQMLQTIDEATSVLKSTTFTQMSIYNYVVESSDIVMPSVSETKTLNIGSETVPNNVQVYTKLGDVIYSTSMYYQTFWLNILMALNWHNSFRLKMGTMMRSSWNRETPKLNSLFGLFKKSSFRSLVNSLNKVFPGEYIDVQWAYQMNMLTSVPSRRSNSITDPVLELTPSLEMPADFKIHMVDDTGKYVGTIFDSNQLSQKVGSDSKASSFTDIIHELVELLSAEHVMAWARGVDVGIPSDNAYFNRVKALIDCLVEDTTVFKTCWNDVREVFDTTAKTGLVTWVKGFLPSIVKETDADLFRNLITEDVYKIMFSGPTKVSFDADSTRWRTYSLWNMYSGIPEYDMRSGGAFLTLSMRDFDETNIPNDVSYITGYLPIGLTGDTIWSSGVTSPCRAVSRDGCEVKLTSTNKKMSEDAVLSRLTPLPSQANLEIKVPVVKNQDATANYTTGHKSTLYKTMQQIFGLGAIQLNNNVLDIGLDSDIVAIYQIELEDITNESTAYARAHSPFRGTEESYDALGFFGFDSNSQSGGEHS